MNFKQMYVGIRLTLSVGDYRFNSQLPVPELCCFLSGWRAPIRNRCAVHLWYLSAGCVLSLIKLRLYVNVCQTLRLQVWMVETC